MLMMIAWEIWKERNAFVFRAKSPRIEDMMRAISGDLEQCRLAGAHCLEPPFGGDAAR